MLSLNLRKSIISSVYDRYSEFRIILLRKVDTRQELDNMGVSSLYAYTPPSHHHYHRSEVSQPDNSDDNTSDFQGTGSHFDGRKDTEILTKPKRGIPSPDDETVPEIQEGILNFRTYEVPPTRDKMYHKIDDNGYSTGGYVLANVALTGDGLGISFDDLTVRFDKVSSDFSYYGYSVIGKVKADTWTVRPPHESLRRYEVLFYEYTGQQRIVYHNDLEITAIRFPMLEA